MRLRAVIGLTIGLALSALFARLGLWQLDRLRERRAFNAALVGRALAPAADWATLPARPRLPDPGDDGYRRVRLVGRFDYRDGLVVYPRSSQGSPGVHLVTPLVLADDTRVLVNRGWVYSPDARTVDLPRWDEPAGPMTIEGYLAPLPRQLVGNPSAVRAAAYLVQTSDTVDRAGIPRRVGPPVFDERNHRNYAIQWFLFAVIAAGGGGLLARRDWARAPQASADPPRGGA